MSHNAKRISKDIILIFLVLLTVFLTARIWSESFADSNSMQSTADTVFSYLKSPFASFFSKNKANTFSQNLNFLLKPEKIIINYGTDRAMLYEDTDEFSDILLISNNLIYTFLTKPSVTKSVVDENEYLSVLKGKSIYIDYGQKLDSRLYTLSIAGTNESVLAGDVSYIKECILTYSDSILNSVFIYIKDYKSNNIYKYRVEYERLKLDSCLKNYFDKNVSNTALTYSFELNFHQTKNVDGTIPKVIFSPLVLVDTVQSERNVLVGKSLIEFNDNDDLNSYMMGRILKPFGISSTTTRKYTDVSNAKVFVENFGTLLINPSGFIEYTGISNEIGVKLSEDENASYNDIYSITAMCVDFAENLCDVFSSDLFSRLRISSELSNAGENQKNYTVTFDYYYNGLPIYQYDLETGKYEHYITIEITDGIIKSYKQFVRSYMPVDEKVSVKPAINAVDNLVGNTQADKLPLEIMKINPCYADIKDDKTVLKWSIFQKGRADVNIIE